MAVATHEAWSVPGPRPGPPNEEGDDSHEFYTQWTLDGKWDVSDAEGAMLNAFMKKYGMEPPSNK
jgi:hypothetical protein